MRQSAGANATSGLNVAPPAASLVLAVGCYVAGEYSSATLAAAAWLQWFAALLGSTPRQPGQQRQGCNCLHATLAAAAGMQSFAALLGSTLGSTLRGKASDASPAATVRADAKVAEEYSSADLRRSSSEPSLRRF